MRQLTRRAMLTGSAAILTMSGCLDGPPLEPEVSGDLLLKNFDGNAHEISVTIADGSDRVFEQNYRLPASSEDGNTLREEGVVTGTGEYQLTTILDGSSRTTFNWNLDDDSRGVLIRVKQDGSIDVGEAPEM